MAVPAFREIYPANTELQAEPRDRRERRRVRRVRRRHDYMTDREVIERESSAAVKLARTNQFSQRNTARDRRLYSATDEFARQILL